MNFLRVIISFKESSIAFFLSCSVNSFSTHKLLGNANFFFGLVGQLEGGCRILNAANL